MVLFAAAVVVPAAVDVPAAHARSHHTNARTGRMSPELAELVKAHRRGDRGALGRLADRIGPARLAQAIGGTDAKVAEAALEAAPLARGGVLLVGAAADQLSAADAARAAAAATALGTLLDGAIPSALEDWDVPPDLVARACGGLQALASRKEAASAARLAALDAALSAGPSCWTAARVGIDVTGLLRDPSPEIRRGALLVAAAGPARAEALREGMNDPDRGVSAAAVAAGCRVEERVGANGRETAPAAPALAAARTLATASTTAAADAVEMLDCLAAGGSAADRAVLEGLRRGPASPLRDRAVELGDLSARGKAAE